MKKNWIVLILTVLVAGVFVACGSKNSGPAPDLTGDWVQSGDAEWYHTATISDGKIEIWWYLPAENQKDLYWSGTFTAPENGKEPYEWESVNDYTEAELDGKPRFYRTSREEVKTFTYKDGKITYNVTAGHLRMTYALERAE